MLALNACFILEQPSDYEVQAQEEAEYQVFRQKLADSVKAYLQDIKSPNQRYKAYDFSEVYEHKPKEIEEYDALVKKRKRLPRQESIYGKDLPEEIAKTDSLIAEKKAYIKANKIHSTFEIGHVFAFAQIDKHIISEYVFFHYPNGKVKDLTVNYSIGLNENDVAYFEDFHYQNSIFFNNREADAEFYDKVYAQLEEEANKAEFIKHAILLIKSIKNNGSLIAEKIILDLSKEQFPEKNIKQFNIKRAKTEGLASDLNNEVWYDVSIKFDDNSADTLKLDEWFRVVP